MVLGVARDQVLLGEGDQGSLVEEVDALDRASGRKCLPTQVTRVSASDQREAVYDSVDTRLRADKRSLRTYCQV